MKDSLIVLGFFVGGCLLGALGYLPVDLKTGNMSIYILYALMFQIGISIGSNKELKGMISQLRLKFLLIPLATIGGTLLFSALASLLLSRWSIFDCMAVGSGSRKLQSDFNWLRSWGQLLCWPIYSGK